MKNLKKLAQILGILMLSLTFVACSDEYWDEEFQEDIVTIYQKGQFTRELWTYAENNYCYAIAGLSDAPNKFVFFSTYENGGRPSYSVVSLMPLDEAFEEIEWQNRNTKGHDFSYTLVPCVYEGQRYWKSQCSRTNSVLLIGNYNSIIRADVFWKSWDVRYEFVTEYSFKIHQIGSAKYWYYQLRER